jgi:hypothetical protein
MQHGQNISKNINICQHEQEQIHNYVHNHVLKHEYADDVHKHENRHGHVHEHVPVLKAGYPEAMKR